VPRGFPKDSVRAAEMNEARRVRMLGQKRPGSSGGGQRKGLTNEDIYGKEKALEISDKIRANWKPAAEAGKYVRTPEMLVRQSSVHTGIGKGLPKSAETKARMKAFWTSERRARRAEESRRRMAERTEHPHGWHISEESRLRRSESAKGRPHPWQVGKPLKEETKRKIAEARKINNPGFLVQCRKQTSSLEEAVSAFLAVAGIFHFRQFQIGQYFTDIFVPSWNTVIECDGAFWHGTREDKVRAKKRDDFILWQGVELLHLPESVIRDDDKFVAVMKEYFK
jgi:very-short-patch-repair endonuclease